MEVAIKLFHLFSEIENFQIKHWKGMALRK